jgi:hypothetical protein
MPRSAVRTEHGLTSRQEKFAQNVAAGMSLTQAHEKAGYGGDGANASRLAARDEIKARIEQLREERRLAFEVRREAQKHAVTSEFASEGVNLKWLIMELRVNLDGARVDSKWKDANDTLKMIAQLTGFLKGDGSDASDPNKRKPFDNDKSAPAINLQVVNQLSRQMGPEIGGQPQALEAVAIPVIQSPDDDDGDE